MTRGLRVADGVGIEQEIDWGGRRGRSIYFRDSDGNSLEFATAALWGSA